MSLRWKITLALLGAGLLAAFSVSALAKWVVQSQFTQSTITRAFNNYTGDVAQYYMAYGSFEEAVKREHITVFLRKLHSSDTNSDPNQPDPNQPQANPNNPNPNNPNQPPPNLANPNLNPNNPNPNNPNPNNPNPNSPNSSQPSANPNQNVPLPAGEAKAGRVRFNLTDATGKIILPHELVGRQVAGFAKSQAHEVRVGPKVIGYAWPEGTPDLTAQERDYLSGLNTAFAWGLLAVSPLLLLFGWLWGGVLARPLRRLSRALSTLELGKVGQGLVVNSSDEMGQMTQSFNQMNQRLSQAYRDLEQARDDAQAASRAKSLFLSNMSHELRTPLNAIIGFSQLLGREMGLKERHREHLQVVARSGEHLLQLINNVLSMAKIEAGKTQLSRGACEIRSLVQDVLSMFRLEAQGRGLRFELEIHPNVPEWLDTDEGKLRQVLLNLISNALKFTQAGGVSVQVDFGTPETLRFEISDTGMGIAPEELPKLFGTFEQTQSGLESKSGTGLGLALSKKFVEWLGGSITVRSKVGVGTTFVFDVSAPIAPADTRHSHLPSPVLAVVGQAPRILVVDDRPENRALLSHLLTEVGFVVDCASDGAEAIVMWQQKRPALIWMDLRMPIMDGLEATRRIRELSQAQNLEVIIIALTASVFEEDEDNVRAQGFDDFVRKPFQQWVIFERMAQYLHLTYRYQETPTPTESPHLNLVSLNLAALPATWRRELSQASDEADYFRIEALLEGLGAEHAGVVTGLRQMLGQYQYPQLQQLAETEWA
jgi:signal transduction histidine kinase/CheY-like chemotaxis protein